MADEATSPPADGSAPAAPVKKSNPFIPLAVVLVAMPAISFVMVNSVFLPKVQKSLTKMVEDAKAAAVAADNAAPLIPPSGGGGEAPKADAAKPAGKDAAKDAGHGKEPAKDAGHGKEPAKDGHKADAAPAGGGDKDKKPSVVYSKDGWSYSFTNVVSNLTGSLGTKYVKCAFSVVSDDQNIGVIVEENKSKLRDAALSVLSARSLADMEASGAKNILRSELAANFNKALNSNVVKQIFFTEFVIQ
jgi:flagellar basal body-associated protein FliL